MNIVERLDHLNLTVADLDESIAWYRDVFGFGQVEEGEMEDSTRWAIVRSDDSMLCMYEHPELASPGSRDGGHHQVNHFGLRIRDRAAWEAVVEQLGIPVRYGGAVRWPHSTSWYVFDPTGWEIEVAQWDDDRVRFDDER